MIKRWPGLALATVVATLALGGGLAHAESALLPAGPEQCLPGVFGMKTNSETCGSVLSNGRAVPHQRARRR